MPKKSVRPSDLGGRPPELLAVLQESAEARKEYFRAYKVAHARIKEVAKELLQLIYEPSDAEVIYLIGPTGVGKSTLMMYVIAELYKAALPKLESMPGCLPAAFMEAENPDKGSYDWRDHYISTLVALDEVLIDKKVYLPDPGVNRDEAKVLHRNQTGGRAALRRAAQNALKNRIKYAFFVDEAQYITKRKSGEGLMNQADTVRSIASRSGTLHVLVGTYDLRHLRNLNGQLGRRSHTVHFRRYTTEDLLEEVQAEEPNAFIAAFGSFQAHLPVKEVPVLTGHLEFCFDRCLGCVGRLKSWFSRSLAIAIEENSKTVTSKMFLKAAPSKVVWRQIAQEIADGEAALDENDEELTKELSRINRAGEQIGAAANSQTAIAQGQKTKATGKGGAASKTSRRNRPFMPKPERHPVGLKESAE